MPFLEGTQPNRGCDIHGVNRRPDNTLRFVDMNALYIDRTILQDLPMPVLRDDELFRGIQSHPPQTMQSNPLSISTTLPTLTLPTLPSNPFLEEPDNLHNPDNTEGLDTIPDLPADVIITEAVVVDSFTADAIATEADDTFTAEAITTTDTVTDDAVLELPSHNPLLD